MIRETSIEAYNTIKENGLLSERRWQVYATLYKHGPCTANELAKHFLEMGFFIPDNINLNIVTRLGELRDLGVVWEVKSRPCKRTGMEVIEWDVTDRLPLVPKKRRTRKCPQPGCSGRIQITEEDFF